MEIFVRSVYQPKGEQCDEDFADGANSERPPTLLPQFTQIRAQTHSRKCQQKRPARKVRQACQLWLGEEAEWRQQRNQKKAQNELGKLAPQKCSLVLDGFGLAARCPIQRISQHHESDERIAA